MENPRTIEKKMQKNVFTRYYKKNNFLQYSVKKFNAFFLKKNALGLPNNLQSNLEVIFHELMKRFSILS